MTTRTSREQFRDGASAVTTVVRRIGSTRTPGHVIKAHAKIKRIVSGSFTAPDPERLHDLRGRMEREWTTHGNFLGLTRRDLAALPWVFFYPGKPTVRETNDWLGANRELVLDWFRCLESAGRRATRRATRMVVTLLRQLLEVWPIEVETFDLIRQRIKTFLESDTSTRSEQWLHRCQKFGFLDRNGPETFGQRWCQDVLEERDVFADEELSAGFDQTAFVAAAAKSYAEKLANKLGDLNARELTRGLEEMEADGQTGLRFSSSIRDLPNIVLGVCGAGTLKPHREVLQEFFLRHYGDPRFGGNTNWRFVDRHCREVMLRWLVSATLEDFFNLLDTVAIERMWKYRRAFWQAYLDEGVIEDAWIVLGRDARRMLSEELRTSQNYGRFKYGERVSSNHAVLVLRMQGLVVADWSHSGRCRIWRQLNERAPDLYARQYSRRDLVSGADIEVTHAYADAGSWQGRVVEWIRREKGFKISPEKYMKV